MADEVKIAQGRYARNYGFPVLFEPIDTPLLLDSNATQDNTSAAVGSRTEIARVYNTGSPCYVVAWDAVGTLAISTVGAQYLASDQYIDIPVTPGVSFISTKII